MGMTNERTPEVPGLPFEPADLDVLDAENHARDLDVEHFDLSWRDRD